MCSFLPKYFVAASKFKNPCRHAYLWAFMCTNIRIDTDMEIDITVLVSRKFTKSTNLSIIYLSCFRISFNKKINFFQVLLDRCVYCFRFDFSHRGDNNDVGRYTFVIRLVETIHSCTLFPIDLFSIHRLYRDCYIFVKKFLCLFLCNEYFPFFFSL